ncbi:hypothetical protein [Crassaminicella profunda]|uniref:hypothetical protein n=1 Tax=Crassaminicella profunda TaxID=1286698 RepID=UPI001CA7471A|nr:hypothetical protein [Crassaminicella profunda]QZY55684.1 hypothetical protein K7H06_01315 [Crassaminicella profunda]
MKMLKLLYINKKNKGFILSYVLLLSMVLLGYLFMIAMRAEGYQPEIYKKGYIYFCSLAFLLSTIILPLWEMKEKDYLKGLVEVLIFIFSAIPLILILLIVGKISIEYILLPLLIQILWGVTIFSIKNILNSLKLQMRLKAFVLIIFNFFVLIFSMIYLFFYSQYANLVITTIFDKDIPSIFFINPLLSLTGVLYEQMGGSNQMGMKPFLVCFVFWAIFSSVIAYSSSKMAKHQGV